MKVIKIILGLVGALVLLTGGFMAGTLISQTRAVTAFAPQFSQPLSNPQQQIQPTVIPQQQLQPFQPTIVPQQSQITPAQQTTPLNIPPQGQWMPGWWMMNPQGEWEHGWMALAPGASTGVQSNSAPQGQQGWGMHDWNNNHWEGMHGGMMNGYGWQANPNSNPAPTTPKGSPTYPTPSAPISFKEDVQPIFAARCVACHGGTNGLYLDTYDNVMKGGINGVVVLPGDVYNSRLAYYVYSGYMPFRDTPLTSAEIQTILDWIAAGALNN